MPRPKLSEDEKQRRKAARLTKWRHQIPPASSNSSQPTELKGEANNNNDVAISSLPFVNMSALSFIPAKGESKGRGKDKDKGKVEGRARPVITKTLLAATLDRFDSEPDTTCSRASTRAESTQGLSKAEGSIPSLSTRDAEERDDWRADEGGDNDDEGFSRDGNWQAGFEDDYNLSSNADKSDQPGQDLLRGSQDINDRVASLRLSLGESDSEDELNPLLLPSEKAAVVADQVSVDSELDCVSNNSDNPTTLLATELLESTSPSIDFAHELGRHLMQFQGCPGDSHLAQTSEHDRIQALAGSTAHLTLNALDKHLIRARVPCVIDKRQLLSMSQRAALPQPNWAQIFDGYEASKHEDSAGSTPSRGRPAREPTPTPPPDAGHLCLRCSQVEAPSAEISFDIDSLLGFADSLAFARQGLTITLSPRFHYNIQTDLHIRMTAWRDSPRGLTAVQVPLHHVPHYCLGRVVGHEDITVYLFFPRMYEPGKQQNFPGRGSSGQAHHLLRTWTDSILIPAVFRHISPSSRQHIPPSWDAARRKAQAYYQEYRSGVAEGERKEVQMQTLHYLLHPQSLAGIWQDIQQQLTDDQHLLYRGVQLLFSSRNTKLGYSYPTLAAVWTAFERTLTATLDFTYLSRERVWIDLGKETVSAGYALPQQRSGADSAPTTFLLRPCCQKSFARWAALGEKDGSVKVQEYPMAMLRDATSTTIEMSRSSGKRQAGWVFSQGYNSIKELYDAANTKPFSNARLSQLAWDPAIEKMIHGLGRGSTRVTKESLICNYQASKERLFNAIEDSRGISFGVREEHRISLPFLDRLRSSLEAAGKWDAIPDRTAAYSRHIWRLSTSDCLTYLSGNANKYMAAFEWITALRPARAVSYEHCKVLTMLLQALPFAFDSGQIEKRGELWKERVHRRTDSPFVVGMGLAGSIERTGYGWLLPRVDWETLTFRPRFADEIAFCQSMLRDAYRRRWASIKDAKDDVSRLEAAARWATLFKGCLECEEWITRFMLVLLMQAYRKYSFRCLRGCIPPEHHAEAGQGRLMFCATEIRRLLGPDSFQALHLVQPCRGAIRSVYKLAAFLWGFDDGSRRGAWDNAPFRILCRRAVEIVHTSYGRERGLLFHDLIFRYFIATHWLIPYPTPTRFLQRDKGRAILWTGVYHRSVACWEPTRMPFMPVEQLLPTTVPQPTKWRPESHPWEGDAPERSQYMEDWDLIPGKTGPFMTCYPQDYRPGSLRFDASLTAITEKLDLQWRVWQQAGAAEPDVIGPGGQARAGGGREYLSLGLVEAEVDEPVRRRIDYETRWEGRKLIVLI